MRHPHALRPGDILQWGCPSDRCESEDTKNWLNRAVAGCNCNRPTLQTIERTGFAPDHVVDGELPKSPFFIRPMIIGSATIPFTAPDP